jgi:hypothetical protein
MEQRLWLMGCDFEALLKDADGVRGFSLSQEGDAEVVVQHGLPGRVFESLSAAALGVTEVLECAMDGALEEPEFRVMGMLFAERQAERERLLIEAVLTELTNAGFLVQNG